MTGENAADLVVDGPRPAVAFVARIPRSYRLSPGDRLILTMLACDSFDGELSAPTMGTLAHWVGMFPSSVWAALDRLASATAHRPALVAREESTRGRNRTVWRLLLQPSDNPGALQPSDDPGQLSIQPSGQPSDEPSGIVEQPPSLPFHREISSVSGAPPLADDGDRFEQFWSLYPSHRRGSKKAVRAAWDNAPLPADVIPRLRAWIPSVKDPKFYPGAEKWLRERRWETITVSGPSREYLAWLDTPEGKAHTARKEAGL